MATNLNRVNISSRSLDEAMLSVVKTSRPKLMFPMLDSADVDGSFNPTEGNLGGKMRGAGDAKGPSKFDRRNPRQSTIEHLRWMQETFLLEGDAIERFQVNTGYGDLPEVFRRHTAEQVETFCQHSGNVWEHSGNIPGTFREHSGNFSPSFLET
jgi:hypothetical protein